jgi:hypothetical protein
MAIISRCDHHFVERITSSLSSDWDNEPFQDLRWTCRKCHTSLYARTEEDALEVAAQYTGPLGVLILPEPKRDI